MGLTPRATQASWNATAPNMLPWSVRAMAFIPPVDACSTSSSMWQAPSRRLYSECRWRWTNSAAPGMSLKSTLARYRSRSFPLDRGGGLAGDVEDHAVDPAHFVDDAARHAGEEVVGQPRPIGGHAVRRLYRPDRHRVLVGAVVAHHPHRPHGQQHGERLPQRAVESGGLDLARHDVVGLAEHLEPVAADGPEAPHGEAGAGERLPVDELLVEAEAQPDEPHLVLEELPQRLDELEAELAREPPHVVVALDHHRRAAHRGRLDHVGVERALG